MDYKKEYKDLYLPKQTPSIIKVPKMTYIMVDGIGNPNDENGEYANAMALLYGLSFTIKMSKKSGKELEGYFEYVVPPLEGLWWMEDDVFDGLNITDKNKFHWTSMIRQPEFVTPSIFEWALSQLQKKKPELDYSKVRLETFDEGLCAQVMHIGPYDDEPTTIKVLEDFIKQEGYQNDICSMATTGQIRRHHEIYLGDPRRTKPENLKTVIRHPIKK